MNEVEALLAATAPERARIGEEVRQRLLAAEGVIQLDSRELDIFLKPNMLDELDCARLRIQIDAKRRPSTLLRDSSDPEFRTSESCDVDRYDPFVQSIEAKLNGLIGIAPENGETIQGQRYAAGQQFKPHHDYFDPREAYWEDMNATGGQRTWTAMVFLNEVEEGGQTFFPSTGVRVTPRMGTLLIWNNMGPDGQPNPYSLHQGSPVTAGTKYIITKWYRERPWI